MADAYKLDEIDRRILNLLQSDAGLSVQSIADMVGLSSNPCWRRIKRLEDVGIIAKRVVLLEPEAVGLGVTVFVMLRTANHSKNWLEAFARSVATIPEIVECHRLNGKDDYLLKVQVESIAHYDGVYKRLVAKVPELIDVSSTFSMEKVKYSTALKL